MGGLRSQLRRATPERARPDYARVPGLAVVIACNAFRPERRNPGGGLTLSPDQEDALAALEQQADRERLAVVHADRLLMRGNNRQAGLMNGEVVVVEKAWHPRGALAEGEFQFVSIHQRGGPYLVHMPSIGIPLQNWQGELKECFDAYQELVREARRFDPEAAADGVDPMEELDDEQLFDEYGAIRPHVAIHVDYGECVTAHTSQGSQWKNVGIVWDNATWALWEGKIGKPDEGRRWAYTSVTRAVENLRVWFVT